MKHQFEHEAEFLMKSHFTLDNLLAVFYFDSVTWSELSNVKNQTRAHEHAWYECHCVKKGCLKIKTDEKDYQIRANEALFIPPRLYHSTTVMADDTKYVCFGFELSKNGKNSMEQLFENMSAAFSTEHCVKLKKCRKLLDTCDDLLAYAYEGGSLERCRFHNMLASFLFILSDKLRDTDPKETTSVLPSAETAPDLRNYLLDYLTSNEINNITLEELSKQIYLNKKQINRIIKKRYNMTYKQKQIRYRIENAKKQLLETDLSVDQISLLVGYTNLTSFYKAFRRIVGVTPKVYRDQALSAKKASRKRKNSEASNDVTVTK